MCNLLGLFFVLSIYCKMCMFFYTLVPLSKNEPTTVAKKIEAATRKSQYLKFGLTQRYEMLHNVTKICS